MKLKMLLCSLVFFGMALYVQASSNTTQKIGHTYSLLKGKMSVSAKLIDAMADSDVPPYFTFLIIVEDAHRRYEVESDIIVVENLDDALGVLKNSIYSNNGYTFIRHECGGGNAWRCNVDSIFTMKEGTLQWVGDMAGVEERGAVGRNYSADLFMDYYDKFESNHLTSHAAAPFLKIYSRDNKGALRVDLEVTWQQNRERFLKEKDVIDQIVKKSAMSEDESRELWSSLLRAAVLAKYCQRTKELDEALQIADRALSKDIVKEFRSILDNVISGELPLTGVKRIR